ncbi:MAG TPA: NAD-dependent succinate-semialdehyde dehydrogenase [Solirubrobacteraceae bacterium]|jgi:succinate-semialdehyde dehydrogenase/glutarate-semialdehyde dehydrogenase|nr:NAD-dependent succinate-semialdehyde dehydrogenase [Solirubrobacteraceae bacterium]
MALEETAIELRDGGLARDRAFIDGEWCDADNGATFPVTNPATGDVLATVPRMGSDETRRAIEAAQSAQEAWSRRPAAERAAILRRLRDLMIENQEDLALLLTLEQGKPLAESRAEIAYAASFCEWFGEEAKRVYGDTIPSPQRDKRILVTKHPIGVCGGITPWNFPSAMVTRKAAPALAVGCTMVLKPAEQTPLSALAIAELARRAGLPNGVLSIVTGDADDAPAIGLELTSNPIVRKVGFTGSNQVGKLIMRQCSDQVKNVSLELGGNAPFIVFADADMEQAVAGALLSKFRNSGQTCITANRMLVHESRHQEFLDRLKAAVDGLVVGDGTDGRSNVGPLIDRPAFDKVCHHVIDAVDAGARLLQGGRPHERGGTFYAPTVLDGLSPGCAIWHEETFGPVAAVRPFGSEREAIELANDTPYGLAAYMYSQDVSRIFRVSEQLETGILGINTGFISVEVAPFGGVKESGIGREGSKYGVDDWIETRYLSLGGI